MADYRKMYYIMCDGAMAILQRALDEAEETYIDTSEEQKAPSDEGAVER